MNDEISVGDLTGVLWDAVDKLIKRIEDLGKPEQ